MHYLLQPYYSEVYEVNIHIICPSLFATPLTRQIEATPMKKTIVITSINPPTQAIKEFATLDDYKVIVVGDKKSPPDWQCADVEFLDLAAQQAICGKLADLLPLNHYCRKIIGYVQAIQAGSDVIVDTDDDNLPYSDWQFPEFTGEYDQLLEDGRFVNIYALFTDHHIWPRGLPLDYVKAPRPEGKTTKTQCHVGIWQGLADLDPDVDAIYRLVSPHPENFRFDKRAPLVLDSETLTPFNSQNTAFQRSCFELLYLPATVKFRFSDILRGYIAQPILAKHGMQLGFTSATVYQLRNDHVLMEDFADEWDVYLRSEEVVQVVGDALKSNNMADNLREAYQALTERKIVRQEENTYVAEWLDAICAHL